MKNGPSIYKKYEYNNRTVRRLQPGVPKDVLEGFRRLMVTCGVLIWAGFFLLGVGVGVLIGRAF